MPTINDSRHIDHGAELAQTFSWIVGPVLGAEVWDGANLAIVYQGQRAYAVVRPDTREYLGCCPTSRHAVALVTKLLAS